MGIEKKMKMIVTRDNFIHWYNIFQLILTKNSLPKKARAKND